MEWENNNQNNQNNNQNNQNNQNNDSNNHQINNYQINYPNNNQNNNQNNIQNNQNNDSNNHQINNYQINYPNNNQNNSQFNPNINQNIENNNQNNNYIPNISRNRNKKKKTFLEKLSNYEENKINYLKKKECTVDFLKTLIEFRKWKQQSHLLMKSQTRVDLVNFVMKMENKEMIIPGLDSQIPLINGKLIYDPNSPPEEIFVQLTNNRGYEFTYPDKLKIIDQFHTNKIITIAVKIYLCKSENSHRINSALIDHYKRYKSLQVESTILDSSSFDNFNLDNDCFDNFSFENLNNISTYDNNNNFNNNNNDPIYAPPSAELSNLQRLLQNFNNTYSVHLTEVCVTSYFTNTPKDIIEIASSIIIPFCDFIDQENKNEILSNVEIPLSFNGNEENNNNKKLIHLSVSKLLQILINSLPKINKINDNNNNNNIDNTGNNNNINNNSNRKRKRSENKGKEETSYIFPTAVFYKEVTVDRVTKFHILLCESLPEIKVDQLDNYNGNSKQTLNQFIISIIRSCIYATHIKYPFRQTYKINEIIDRNNEVVIENNNENATIEQNNEIIVLEKFADFAIESTYLIDFLLLNYMAPNPEITSSSKPGLIRVALPEEISKALQKLENNSNSNNHRFTIFSKFKAQINKALGTFRTGKFNKLKLIMEATSSNPRWKDEKWVEYKPYFKHSFDTFNKNLEIEIKNWRNFFAGIKNQRGEWKSI